MIPAYILFILTIIGIFFLLKNKITIIYHFALDDFMNLEYNFKNLTLEEKELKNSNLKREQDMLRTMSLYEANRQICEFLEEDKIFLSFKNGLKEFVHFQECYYLDVIDKADNNLNNFEVIPLASEKDNYGYLAIKGLMNEERHIFNILIAQYVSSLKRAKLYKCIQESSITDSLTRVFTRKYCLDRFEEELKRLKELKLSLSVFMIDIDNFKPINDKYGHLAGDAVLKNISDIIKLNCREIDLLGRFGGEEFIVILPLTSKDGALFAAERIRKSVESAQIKAFDELLNVTVSIGIASFPEDAKAAQELIDKSDWALYRSKHTGKNKTSAYARYK